MDHRVLIARLTFDELQQNPLLIGCHIFCLLGHEVRPVHRALAAVLKFEYLTVIFDFLCELSMHIFYQKHERHLETVVSAGEAGVERELRYAGVSYDALNDLRLLIVFQLEMIVYSADAEELVDK